MMQLGFTTAILPSQSLEEVFSVASDCGYDCVEVMCWPAGKDARRYAGITHIDVAGLDDAKVSEIHALSAKYGVAISALGYYPNPLSPNQQEAEAAVAHFRDVIAAAAKLGIYRANSFIGRDWTKSVDENWPRFLETWEPIIRYAESLNVKVGIENCPMFFTGDEWPGGKNLAHSPAIWKRMFTDLPSDHFGLNFDPSHLVWQQIDYLLPLREFADKLFHVHAKDVRIDREKLNQVGILAVPNDYHTPKLPGMGEIDWGRFFSILGDVGYRGPVCVEVEDRIFEDSDTNRKLSLQQSATYLRNFVPRR
ncbi:sugar phosphate isomerase/epimerase family protein [Novipirellula artificiosorum]|uniref:Inosose dehydratase n=1 Tax=Novipirellula artificiosorum TaxID=2528016 RepID=A0A5C6DYF8_9BACT|nr:sugar phosphate isomerase/epimerase family protein [Novipirellula artificiosorum]TWU42473.1 Inosose dehydratase [Novipirellula artificiosorum]